MRFLHTADWHVGKTLFGRSRLDEQEQVIAEIVEIARREKVDCVLLAGDVFESLRPQEMPSALFAMRSLSWPALALQQS